MMFKKKIDQCSKDLEWWNKNCFGNVKRDLEKRKKSLERVETEARRIGINEPENSMLKLIFFWIEKSECGVNDQGFCG